jgi:hypothetical protein
MTNYSSKFPKKISSEVAAVNDAVKKYTALAEKKLLKSPQDVDADEYFDAGTDVIDLIIKVYNTTNNAILEDSKGWL